MPQQMTGPVFSRRLLAAIRDVSELISSDQSERDVLLAMLRVLETRLGLQDCKVVLSGLDGRDMVLATNEDLMILKAQGIHACRGHGLSRKVRQSDEPAVVEALNQHAQLKQCRRRNKPKSGEPDRSLICVPIKLNQEVIGTLSGTIAYQPEVDAQIESHLLSIIAGMMAVHVSARRAILLEREALKRENQRLRDLLSGHERPAEMIGDAPAMQQVFARISQVAPADTRVLLRGEPGTGKEVAARAIHAQSPRADGPLVVVSCVALNESLLESELFGHVEGAFTGATSDRKGRIAEAEGGTLMLDEIGELPLQIQVKLLRFLQEQQYEPVGSNETCHADVRIVAATHRNLEQEVAQGCFREDLFYRISVFTITLPPLRERKSDIMSLASHFVQHYSVKNGKPINQITRPVMECLTRYDWPGNVRELENWIEYAVLTSTDEKIHLHNLPNWAGVTEASMSLIGGTLKERLDNVAREIILQTLKRYDNRVALAAEELGITPRMLNYKIKQWGLKIERSRGRFAE